MAKRSKTQPRVGKTKRPRTLTVIKKKAPKLSANRPRPSFTR